jgi:hypothetical protein
MLGQGGSNAMVLWSRLTIGIQIAIFSLIMEFIIQIHLLLQL